MRFCGLVLGLVIGALAASSASAVTAASPTLGDSFAITFTVKTNQNFGARPGTRYTGLNWYFQPRCQSGPCSVRVSATPSSCVSGSCPQQWPGGFLWAQELLRYSANTYTGSFVVKSNCFTAGIPYAYRQQTKVVLHVSRSARIGTTLKATRIDGTITMTGTPDSYSLQHGCQPYTGKLAFQGTRRG